MNNEEKILELLLAMRSDISELKDGQNRLEMRMERLEMRMDGLEQSQQRLEMRQESLEQSQQKLELRQENLEQHIISLEHELVPKVTVLFDAYELRGDQIAMLKNHFDGRLDDFQEDIAYLISKTAKHEKQIIAISKRLRQVAP